MSSKRTKDKMPLARAWSSRQQYALTMALYLSAAVIFPILEPEYRLAAPVWYVVWAGPAG